MRRVLCVWLPRWPIQRLRRERTELKQVPLILYAPSRGRMVVALCSPRASKERIKPGMPLAEARAILGIRSLVRCEPCDAEADRRTLRRLALWCQCFTPLVAVEEPDSLFLDITGCGPLFGGERNLAAKALAQLRRLGLIARAAVADTAGAAWALAHHHAANGVVVPPGQHRHALRTLPVTALRLSAEVVQLLQKFDIVRLEQLQRLPRAVLPARFGPQVLLRLDQALGDIAEPLLPVTAREPIALSWSLDYPCGERRLLEKVLEHLLERMLAKLRPRQLGIQRLVCELRPAGAAPRTLTVGLLHASASPAYLLGMLRLHLDRTHLPGEITGIRLHAVEVVPVEFHQEMLFGADEQAERGRQFAPLVELLSNRLGKEAVLRPRPSADAQPELAWRYEPWLEHEPPPRPPSSSQEQAGAALVRPVFLQARPVAVTVMAVFPGGPPLRFVWNGRDFAVVRFWGPERIQTGWWRGPDVCRDYYLVETVAGDRFWLFRTAATAWFLHGTFS